MHIHLQVCNYTLFFFKTKSTIPLHVEASGVITRCPFSTTCPVVPYCEVLIYYVKVNTSACCLSHATTYTIYTVTYPFDKIDSLVAKTSVMKEVRLQIGLGILWAWDASGFQGLPMTTNIVV